METSNWALVNTKTGIVDNVIVADSNFAAPAGYQLVAAAGAAVGVGWAYSNGAFSPPAAPADTTPIVTLRALRTAALTDAIAALEAEQHRATREALVALMAGTAPTDIAKTAAGQRLAAVDSQAATLRALLPKIAAAATAADLAAITWS
ncbi:hypothetical protein [Chromobacterium sp. CV08]|uniref:hypothetical protein n=1 Tax=Chromobacterium sp. CV08 TaxID=3133274 RepID=UPI003DA8D4D6